MNRSQKCKTGAVILLFLVIAAVSAVLTRSVSINYSIADYLGDDTDTKQALRIMEEDFGMTTDIKVMVGQVDETTAAAIADELATIDAVLTVGFDTQDPHHYKENTALFSLMIDGGDYSDQAVKTIEEVKTVMAAYEGHPVTYGGTCVDNQTLRQTITTEMPRILAIAIGLVVVILLLVSASWLEPFVLLFSAGVAVLINLGTNAIFGEISYITNSVAAILQLALSIDYSIMLLHAYRREREHTADCVQAAKNTVKAVLRPVSASAMTTLAGLLALLFMSFRIGFDIGMVLMKGIVLSAVISLTLFPLLILWLEKPMQKTPKRAFTLRGKCFCTVAMKAGRVVLPIFLVLLVASGMVCGKTRYTFSTVGNADTSIADTFGESSQVVLVYENTTDNVAAEQAFVDRLAPLKNQNGSAALLSYTAYSNTVGQEYDAASLATMLGVPEKDAAMLIALCGLYADPDSVRMTAAQFMEITAQLLENDPDVAALVDDEAKAKITALLQTQHPLLSGATTYHFRELAVGVTMLMPSAQGMISEDMIAGVYMKYALANGKAVTAVDAVCLVDFAAEHADSPLLSSRLTAEHTAMLQQAQAMLQEASALFRTETYSRMVLSLDLQTEGESTTAFMEEALDAADDVFGERAYLAGVIPSTYDLCKTFEYDNVFISVFTIISIFLIVMAVFRSLSLPVILVAVIQGAIWFMMSVLFFAGQEIFFMGYIMASCILMGATIDYGILMSSNYVDLRRTVDRKTALLGAVEAAMPTVFTSGSILTIAGIVIYFISSQAAISIVGLLVGVGALTSTVFITVVLPSLLWLFDAFVMKLTMKKKG